MIKQLSKEECLQKRKNYSSNKFLTTLLKPISSMLIFSTNQKNLSDKGFALAIKKIYDADFAVFKDTDTGCFFVAHKDYKALKLNKRKGLTFIFHGNNTSILDAREILHKPYCIMMIYPGCSDMENAKIKDIEFSKMKKNVFKTFENIKKETKVENENITLYGFSVGNLFTKHILDNSKTKMQEVQFDAIPTKYHLNANTHRFIPCSKTLSDAFIAHETKLSTNNIPERACMFGNQGDDDTPPENGQKFLREVMNGGAFAVKIYSDPKLFHHIRQGGGSGHFPNPSWQNNL
jgi:hypothetical protein